MNKLSELEEAHKSITPITNINHIHRRSLSLLEKLALVITNKVGTMGFFFLIATWTVVWLGWNIVAPKSLRFDPFPGFVLWLFISNLIQIHLMPLIMVGQNIQGKHQELRSQHDYETDKRAAADVNLILAKLDNQNILMKEILTRLDEVEKKKKLS